MDTQTRNIRALVALGVLIGGTALIFYRQKVADRRWREHLPQLRAEVSNEFHPSADRVQKLLQGNGHDWQAATPSMQQALAEYVSHEVVKDNTHAIEPGVNVLDARDMSYLMLIDSYYKSHPDRLSTPISEVLAAVIAKPASVSTRPSVTER